MNRTFIFIEEANSDIEKAYEYYFKISFELAEKFLEQLTILLHILNDNPFLFQITSGKKRKAPLKQFPFAIYYRADNNVIVVLAVFHHKRNPSIIRKRKLKK